MTDLFERPTVQDGPTRATRAAQRERRAAKRRRQRRRRAGMVVVLALVLIAGGGYYLVTHAESVFGFANPVFRSEDYPGPGEQDVDVTIAAGATGRAMGATLVDAGVVASVKAFVDAYEANPGAAGIQPGVHTLKTRMKAADAVAALVANESKVETKVTIPEGFTVSQIVERASSVTGIPAADFDAAFLDTAATGLPAEAGGVYEGWLFPTTYVLDPDETATSLIYKMVHQTVLELDAAGVPAERRQEVLTIASLIEREAKYPPDRPKMARVIQNRIEQGWPLQIDAAVAYGLGRPGTTLTDADTKDTGNPYNTYAFKGLPPTPIASPGLSSVQAALNPEPGPWMFWVAVNLDTGETKFAATYEEHQRYVAELRAWQEANPQ